MLRVTVQLYTVSTLIFLATCKMRMCGYADVWIFKVVKCGCSCG